MTPYLSQRMESRAICIHDFSIVSNVTIKNKSDTISDLYYYQDFIDKTDLLHSSESIAETKMKWKNPLWMIYNKDHPNESVWLLLRLEWL